MSACEVSLHPVGTGLAGFAFLLLGCLALSSVLDIQVSPHLLGLFNF